MEINDNPQKVPEEYLCYLGSAAYYWSMADLEFQRFIWELLLVPRNTDNGLIVTNEMFMSNKIKLANRLLHQWRMKKYIKDGLCDEISSLINSIETLNSDRNRLMHGYFFTDESGKTSVSKVALRSGNISETEHFGSVSKYKEFIRECCRVTDDFKRIGDYLEMLALP